MKGAVLLVTRAWVLSLLTHVRRECRHHIHWCWFGWWETNTPDAAAYDDVPTDADEIENFACNNLAHAPKRKRVVDVAPEDKPTAFNLHAIDESPFEGCVQGTCNAVVLAELKTYPWSKPRSAETGANILYIFVKKASIISRCRLSCPPQIICIDYVEGKVYRAYLKTQTKRRLALRVKANRNDSEENDIIDIDIHEFNLSELNKLDIYASQHILRPKSSSTRMFNKVTSCTLCSCTLMRASYLSARARSHKSKHGLSMLSAIA